MMISQMSDQVLEHRMRTPKYIMFVIGAELTQFFSKLRKFIFQNLFQSVISE